MPQILSVSYDEKLLITRQQVLETKGYAVASASALSNAVELCRSNTPFALFILGHSIPNRDKEALIKAFRSTHPTAPIVALTRSGEEPVAGADFSVAPIPEQLLRFIDGLVSGKSISA